MGQRSAQEIADELAKKSVAEIVEKRKEREEMLPLEMQFRATKQNYSEFIVSQTKELIRAADRLTLNEKRLVFMALSLINSKGDNARNTYNILVSDYAELFEISLKIAYRDVRNALDRLYERSWTLRTQDGKKGKGSARWISEKFYFDGEGEVSLTFSPSTMHHLKGLGNLKPFKSQLLKSLAKFKSSYSWKLYQLLNEKVYSKTDFEGLLIIKVDDFRHSLEVPKSYQYGIIKSRIILPAIQEIEQLHNLKIEFSEVKKVRRVDVLEFRFEEDEQQQLDLQGCELLLDLSQVHCSSFKIKS